MPRRKGYKTVRKKGKTYMVPKARKGSGKRQQKKLGSIYASCRSSKAHRADTPENKGYCARVAHSRSGA